MTKITGREFGQTATDRCTEYVLENENLRVSVLSLGGVIRKIEIPDRKGQKVDVVLGYDTLGEYLHSPLYFGAVVGPVAGRIPGPYFEVNGKEYRPEGNAPGMLFHGGAKGFTFQFFTAELLPDGEGQMLKLSYHRPDGESGFPGNLDFSVTYRLCGSALLLEYRALCDQESPFNPTNHSYFDLSGKRTLEHQVLSLASSQICGMDDRLFLTAERHSVEGGPYDFREPKCIGEQLHAYSDSGFSGLDTCYLFDQVDPKNAQATLFCPQTGIGMEVYTTLPAAVVYTANGIRQTGKGGAHYGSHSAICFETEEVLLPQQPGTTYSPALRANSPYFSYTKFQFFIK